MDDLISRRMAIEEVGLNTWAGSRISKLTSAQPKTCDYWDNESNYCTLNKPSVIDVLCDNCDNMQAVCAHYPCKQYLALEKQLSAHPESKKIEYLLDELSKKPPMVIATAYLYAINYTLYGEDVTKAWTSAVQNSSALEKAYNEGYYDALHRQSERRTDE